MIKILRNKDFNITDFLVDNVEGVNELSHTNTCSPGSTAYVIETGETFIKRVDGEWTAKVADKFGEPIAPKLTIEFFAAHVEGLGEDAVIEGDFEKIIIPAYTLNTSFYADVELPLTKNIVFSPYNVGSFQSVIYVNDVKVGEVHESYQSAPIVILSNDMISQYNITVDSQVRLVITQIASE